MVPALGKREFSWLGVALGMALCLNGPVSAQEGAEQASAPPAAKETEGSKALWGTLIFAVKDAALGREGFKDVRNEMGQALLKAFPKYRRFQVLGMDSEALFKTTHSWVAPSKELCVKFDSKGPTKDGRGVRVDLQLWNRGKAILKTDAIFRPGSPVFIEGPAWGAGRLLYVLEMKDGKMNPSP